MLTAESGYRAILDAGYSLVITNISVTTEKSNPSNWTPRSVAGMRINNSTEQSPTLVRIKDVATGSKTFEVNVSAQNDSQTTLAITSFKVRGNLWYANYTDQDHSLFAKYDMGELPGNSLIYDNDMWNVTYSEGVYTFTQANSGAHLPVGYGIKLLSGVTISKQYYPTVEDPDFVENTDSQGNKYFNTIAVNDFWCTLDVFDVQTTATVNYSGVGYTGVEVVAEGYYSAINAGATASIYLKNNTNQDITSVSLTNLRLATLNSNSSTLLARDNLNTSTEFDYVLTNHLTGVTKTGVKSTTNTNDATSSVTIRPNEKVLLYTITPSAQAVLYTYNVSVELSSAQAVRDVEMTFDVNNASSNTVCADIVNNSSSHYEFRLVSSIDLSDCLASDEFVEQQVDGTYYYYYKGVLYSHQAITLFNEYVGVTIECIAHIDGANAEHYVADNYTTWNPPAEWLTSMQAIFGEPDRANAIVVTIS